MFQYTGEYIKTKSIYGGEFYAFTPAQLCSGNLINMDDELLNLITVAHNLLGILNGITMYHPDDVSIKRLIILKECWCSLQIDGKNDLSFSDVLKKMSCGRKDESLISNLTAAYDCIYDKSVVYPNLLEVYRTILYGSNSEAEVKIRSQAIPFSNVITNLKIYNPTAPEHIMNALYDMIKFISMENHTDIFIKAAMAHYQFEMIHPFEDCNGLIGRILIQMILHGVGHRGISYMCLSEYLLLHKEEYFDKLSSTQSGGGFLPWVKFFLRAICYASEQAVGRIKKITEIIATDEKQIVSLSQSSKYIIPIYNYFKKYLVSELKPIAEKLEISYNTVSKVVKILSDAGLLRIEVIQARHKVFQCYKLMHVIN